MTFRLGLTGSIGMGKSTTAAMFAEMGCAVWDADACVHRLYSKGGAAVAPVGRAFPQAIVQGAVSRDKLRELIAKDPDHLRQIEKIVHPLVQKDRADFARMQTTDIVVFDIPLLFETGAETEMDAVICVTVSPELQKSRVMERGTMSLEQFETIRAKQMPNDEKCRRSDYVVETDTKDHARQQVQNIVSTIRKQLTHA